MAMIGFTADKPTVCTTLPKQFADEKEKNNLISELEFEKVIRSVISYKLWH